MNKSVGKGLADAIDTGEKAVDSTKQTLGSTKRKATDTADDAKGVAQEKIDQASKSTKEAAESTRQKFNQTAGEARNKADRVCLLFYPLLSSKPNIFIPGMNQFRVQGGVKQREKRYNKTDPKPRVRALIVPLIKSLGISARSSGSEFELELHIGIQDTVTGFLIIRVKMSEPAHATPID